MSWIFGLPWDHISQTAIRFNLDRLIVAAIVMTESSGDPDAERYEVNYRWLYKPESFTTFLGNSLSEEKKNQRTSFGYMQVMGAVCRELGYSGPLKAIKSNLSLHYGCMLFARLLKKHDDDIHKAIASYNAGSPRYARNGDFVNQGYVDKVLGYYNTLTKVSLMMKDQPH